MELVKSKEIVEKKQEAIDEEVVKKFPDLKCPISLLIMKDPVSCAGAF